MTSRPSFCCRRLAALPLVLGCLLAIQPLAATTSKPNRGQCASDPGGVGGVPYSGPCKIQLLPTAGLIVDAVGHPVPFAAIVVTDNMGSIVAQTNADAEGVFTCALPSSLALDLAAPEHSVFGVPVVAGVPIVVVVP